MKQQPDNELIRKLEAHLEAAPDFTSSDRKTIHEMVAAWRGVQAMGKVSKWLVVTLGLIAGALVAASTLSTTLKAGLKSWLG